MASPSTPHQAEEVPMDTTTPPHLHLSALASQMQHMLTPTRTQPPATPLHASRSIASRQSRRTQEGTPPSSRSQMPRDETPTGRRRSQIGNQRRPALPFRITQAYRVGDAKADGNCFFRYNNYKNHTKKMII